ncbi:uncharacterized protein LOC134100403 [Sardina pilchardus]|uniref:uncharacterized protein LOC134100403 n=1 Tax=Sardina pilchardus TaxID=27697 RepID=UPI002E113B17
MREKGFERSSEQCRLKVKKLRQKYIQVRDALRKTGSSGKEKDKFIWFDEVDKILGTKPVVDPVDMVENDDREAEPTLSVASSDSSYVTHASDPDADDVEDSSNALDESDVVEAQGTENEEKEPEDSEKGGKLPIPGAKARKRKAKSNRVDDEVVEYLAESRKMMQEIQGSEQRRLDQESANFDKYLNAQREAEERRFHAMQLQQQASNQMIMQLVSTLVNTQHHHSSAMPSWNTTTTPTTSRAWPPLPHPPSQSHQQLHPTVEQPVIPQYPPASQYPSASPNPSTSQQDNHSVSSILRDVNTQLFPM